MIWNHIKTINCVPQKPDDRFEAYLTRNPVPFTTPEGPDQRYWVIGPYEKLKELARAFRVDAAARASSVRVAADGRSAGNRQCHHRSGASRSAEVAPCCARIDCFWTH